MAEYHIRTIRRRDFNTNREDIGNETDRKLFFRQISSLFHYTFAVMLPFYVLVRNFAFLNRSQEAMTTRSINKQLGWFLI